MVVTPAACAQRGADIVREYTASVALGQGQVLRPAGLRFLPAGQGPEDHLSRGITAVPPVPLLGSWISAAHRAALVGRPAVRPPAPHPRAGESLRSAPLTTTAEETRTCPELLRECFGPASLTITYTSADDLPDTLRTLPGGLTASLHGQEREDGSAFTVCRPRRVRAAVSGTAGPPASL
ncbi:hypothetical protein [Streptomyces sp. NPDC000229]|uniref:hypothetical protein n=1 Tax=Streptomyces sp. NPDC000229 TaxID=3154247 RepID=UPI003326C91E